MLRNDKMLKSNSSLGEECCDKSNMPYHAETAKFMSVLSSRILVS